MHIPAYARATIRAELPLVPTPGQVAGLDCCFCNEPFGRRAPVSLGGTEGFGLFACRPCLTHLVARARQLRDSALVRKAEQARKEATARAAERGRYLAELERVRRAAEAVAYLVTEKDLRASQTAWLFMELESAYAWVEDGAPEQPASVEDEDEIMQRKKFQLALEMISTRFAVANSLAYRIINDAMPPDPELCEEMECPEGCDGKHDFSDIDCGPDAILESLVEFGIDVEEGEYRTLSHPVEDGEAP